MSSDTTSEAAVLQQSRTHLLQLLPLDAHIIIWISTVDVLEVLSNKVARGIGAGKEALSVLRVGIACCCCCHGNEQISDGGDVVDYVHGGAEAHFIKLMTAQGFAACDRLDACKLGKLSTRSMQIV